MPRTKVTLALFALLSVGAMSCKGGSGKGNTRDPQLEAQRQKIDQAIHHVEAQVGQVVAQAQQSYQGALRSAEHAKSQVNARIEKVDHAAQGMVEQAKKVEQMASAAADKAQSMVGAVETAWSNYQPSAGGTPASTK